MKVFVYKNIRTGRYSVKALEGKRKGRVIARRASLELTDCEFRVSEAGRQRVLREGRKSVHAGVVGNYDLRQTVTSYGTQDAFKVAYNPYFRGYFWRLDRLCPVPVRKASRVVLDRGGVFAYENS
jgi:hypothetical protein